ncbi:MAG TPA: hypothetical protein VF032_05515 [Thermoleophilaceae bacterium]
MSIFICWVLFPLLYCLLSVGCGLLVQRASGFRMSGVLLLPVGYATIVVASQCTTYFQATTFLATPLVIALAVAGYALAVAGRRTANGDRWSNGLWPMAYDLWPGLAALATFAVYAAPVVLSGQATFLGYTLLGDTSIHFVLIDRVMSHGHSAAGLAPSSYHSVVSGYYTTAYPLGAHTALGAVRPLVGQDVAWVFQPYLALLAAFSALSIYALLARTFAPRWLVALGAFLAAQSGLMYAYALEGSIKELATVALIATLVAVGAEYVSRRGGVRAVIPLALVAAAGMGVLNASVLPWFGPVLLAVLVATLALRGTRSWRSIALEIAVFAGLGALLSYQALAMEGTFIHQTTVTFSLTSGSNLGNLLAPLSKWHGFGIWPTGDFRLGLSSHVAATYALIGLEIGAIVLGVLWALRWGTGWPLVFLGASLVGWAYVTARTNAWGDAKALMILSPALLAVAILGPASLWRSERRIEGLLLAAAIAFGVLWTNALAYHGVDLAPRGRFDELASIGQRFAGQGPALYTEFEEFGKHFLRQADPSGSNESWQDEPRATLVDGAGTRFGFSSDIDELSNAYVQRFRLLVLRRSGSASRPPSNYQLVYSGRFYEVWRRSGPGPVQRLALGNSLQPGSVPRCSAVRSLSRAGSRLAYVERPALPILMVAQARHPAAWLPDGADPTNLRPYGPGTLTGAVTVKQPARYQVWVQGSFGRGYTVYVDNELVGRVRRELNPRGQFASPGAAGLSAGRHTIRLVRPGGSLYPGNGGRNRLLGPVVLDPATDARVVRVLPSGRWRSLCGRRLDWVEALR